MAAFMFLTVTVSPVFGMVFVLLVGCLSTLLIAWATLRWPSGSVSASIACSCLMAGGRVSSMLLVTAMAVAASTELSKMTLSVLHRSPLNPFLMIST